MSAYTTSSATCSQDISLAAQATLVIEQLAESFESFRDKRPVEALGDVHSALLQWEELSDGLDPSDGTDLMITIQTEDTRWEVDMFSPQWVIDLPMSLFHGKLMFTANTDAEIDE